MVKKNKIIALIPAREGSNRIKNKNIKKLFGIHLIGHAINSAKKSRIFDRIIVSTDSKKYASISRKYGADVPFLRPKKFSKSNSPDYEWVKFTLDNLLKKGEFFTHFFILRPTNPFRSYKTIRRAWKKFESEKQADSLRAIELCKQHPGKMWKVSGKFMSPFFKKNKFNQPYHNLQFKSLPTLYIQNASLEISKTDVLFRHKTITGKKIIPFFTKKKEGFDINYPIDLKVAEILKK